MKQTLAIAQRELNAFFFSPIAYVVMCLYLLLAGVIFVIFQFQPTNPAELRTFFMGNVWLLIAITPALSMRLVSEELRSGTIEPLMTSPVSDNAVILGKWLGALAFFVVLLMPTAAFVVVLCLFANPDPGPLVSGYFGTLLVGGIYLAMGVFASVLTRNQVIAFLLSMFIILLFTVLPQFLPLALPDFTAALHYINVYSHYEDFAKGLIDGSDFLFFLTGIAVFLALAVKTLESRKWR